VGRGLLGLLGAIVFVAAFACGDPYKHTNPYDPLVPVEISLTGPDTLFSYGELGQYSAQSVPALPDSSFQFGSSDSIAFAASGHGAFISRTPPLYPATQTVRVMAMLGQIDTVIENQDLTCPYFPPCSDLSGLNCPFHPPCKTSATHTLAWRHSGSKDVMLTQRIVRIQLRCPADHACDPLAAGAAWTVWADGFDALNFQVVALTGVNANPAVSAATPVFATFAVRDSTIAGVSPVGIRAATVTARKPGTTWIVATRGSLLDSLALVVH
jgi:hypothetical protein